MDAIEPESDASPVVESAAASSDVSFAKDARPWRLRRPVLAGVVLYGALAAVIATIGWFWMRERELGRQDGLLTKVFGVSGSFALDYDRSIQILENDVLSQNPSEDTRRRALLLLAAVYDASKRFDESDRTYELVRRDWPTGLELGPLNVPWANMLVTAGKPARAKELLSPSGATSGYGAAEEVAVVRARIVSALERPGAATGSGSGGSR